MIQTSAIKWEYEDQLPEMTDDEFDEIESRIVGNHWGGVRMYPYVEDENGNRIWITGGVEYFL